MPRKGQVDETRFSPAWWAERTLIDPVTGCHKWTGFLCREGRGRVWYKGKGGVLIHRIAYELAYGEFDSSLKVCHKCDNPSCVNPEHLFLGTQKDNLRDMFAKGRGRPRGRAQGWRQKAAPLAQRELLSENPHSTVGIDYGVHLRRTLEPKEAPGFVAPVAEEVVPAWCRVIGVPACRPTQAIQIWRRPLEWTDFQGLSSPHIDHGREAGAVVQAGFRGARGRRT